MAGSAREGGGRVPWRGSSTYDGGMNTVVIEHVPIAELPTAWRNRLDAPREVRVTIRIEAESEVEAAQDDPILAEFANDPSFGMWRDREDMADVEGYLRRVRTPRFLRGESSSES